MCNNIKINEILSNILVNIKRDRDYVNHTTDEQFIGYNITVTNNTRIKSFVSSDYFEVEYDIVSLKDIKEYDKLKILFLLIELDIRTNGTENIKLKSIFSDKEFNIIIDKIFTDIILNEYSNTDFTFSSKYIAFELSISTDGDFAIPIPDEFKYNLEYLDTQRYKFTYLLKTDDSIECINNLYKIIKNIYEYFSNINFTKYEKFKYKEQFANFIRYLLIVNTLSKDKYILDDYYDNGNYSIEATIRGLNKRKVENSDEFIYYLEV